jgi:AraC-like DNA-binding protein
MKERLLFEPHLALNEVRMPNGGEWRPHFRGWCLLYIGKGISYWQDQHGAQEITTGSTLVLCGEARGVLRASQLNEVTITYFCVETGKLLGLLSWPEQHFLKQIAERKNLALRVLSPESLISERFKNLRPNASTSTSSMRLRLLQLFMDLFELEFDQDAVAPVPWKGGRERFRQLLNQMAASEFMELSVSDLVPMMSCSRRHLHRLFREELGASFREKQIELRLAKACELLATSNAKVVEVALESGYQSSSVFSELFKKRFGVSPGQWRRERLDSRAAPRVAL